MIKSTDPQGREYHRALFREALRLIFLARFNQAGLYKPRKTVVENGVVRDKRGSTWHNFRRGLVSRMLDEPHDLVTVQNFIDHAQSSTLPPMTGDRNPGWTTWRVHRPGRWTI